jgi:hypothetical protein
MRGVDNWGPWVGGLKGVEWLATLDCGEVGDTVVMEESSTVHPFKATIFGFVDGDGGMVMLGFGIGKHRGIE